MPTPIIQLEEKALVAAWMNILWVPRDPRASPLYAYKNKGYCLTNIFDPSVGGEMTGMFLSAGEPTWVDRIRDNFLHPSSENLAAFGVILLGVPLVVKPGPGKSPTRKGTILLSSEESTRSSHGLIHRSSRAGPLQSDKDSNGAQTRKHSSKAKLLDYVVGSGSLSGLDTGTKRLAADEDDQISLTQMTEKKRKILADRKQELDEQAALALSEKKLKVMGHATAPSDSEVDLRVFAKKSGILIEQIYEASSQPKGTSLG
ncbi:hypothetical protein Hanom_Chr04g00321181 [Helianthus anomalus]